MQRHELSTHCVNMGGGALTEHLPTRHSEKFPKAPQGGVRKPSKGSPRRPQKRPERGLKRGPREAPGGPRRGARTETWGPQEAHLQGSKMMLEWPREKP
eukprot:7091462-Pyramimonas_sp.AAC.1